MDLIVAIGALVLVGLLIVGLFHGPSHRDARPRPHRRARATPSQAGSVSPGESAPGATSSTGTTTGSDAARGEPAPGVPTGPMVSPLSLAPATPSSATQNEPPAYVLPPPRRPRRVHRRPVNGPRGRHS